MAVRQFIVPPMRPMGKHAARANHGSPPLAAHRRSQLSPLATEALPTIARPTVTQRRARLSPPRDRARPDSREKHLIAIHWDDRQSRQDSACQRCLGQCVCMLTSLGLSCASKMLGRGCEVQAE